MSAVTHTYTYAAPSAVDLDTGAVNLATSGGAGEQPQLFDGAVDRPRQLARGLLCIGNVASTRFFEPMTAQKRAAMLDPVITVHDDRIRFEAFSSCCTVYARYDHFVDGGTRQRGTTNIDLNPPMRAALARVTDQLGVLLHVGHDEVVVTGAGGVAVERKVPLPERWLKGFAEVQLAMGACEPRIELAGTDAARFLDRPPSRRSRTADWLVPVGRSARFTATPTGDHAVQVDAPFRIKPLAELRPFLRRLTVHGPAADRHADEDAPSTWVLDLPDAQLTLALSPALNRGFSGEGGALVYAALGDPVLGARVGEHLDGQARLEPERLSLDTGLSAAAVDEGIGQLVMQGRLGYDPVDQSCFHRDLPFDRSRLEAMHPRLRSARGLVEAGGVQADGDAFTVDSDSGNRYRVGLGSGADAASRVRTSTCTCEWHAKHGGSRGPCKHVLSVHLAIAG